MYPMSRRYRLDLRRADTPAQLFAMVEHLAGGLAVMGRPTGDLTDGPVTTTGDLRRDGYVQVSRICRRATCEALSAMIERLLEAGLPAVFVLATDAALELGARIERAVSALMGCRYVVVEDAWAWRISPGSSGWPPHRGVTSLLDRNVPEALNTWVALSDVEIDRSCMHFVSLGDDPAYPGALDRIDAVPPGRAMPVAAGSLLFWNANVLHWGGACSPQAAGPRFSCSYSLARLETPHSHGTPIAPHLTAAQRIDLIAGQIATYGAGQPDVSPEVLDWARATVALRRLRENAP